jgi:SAM-dependent methyltransferase
MNTKKYWEQRYKEGGNSGAGSYGRLSKFKSDIINNIIKKYNIKTILDLGCGDGNQLSYFKINNYVGYDISKTIILKNQIKFKYDNTKQFIYNLSILNNKKFDLVLSLDVIYHLLEEELYQEYLNNLIKYSNKYILIYSSNKIHFNNKHIKERKFTNDLKKKKEIEFIQFIPNKYPFKNDPINESISNFYLYKKL